MRLIKKVQVMFIMSRSVDKLKPLYLHYLSTFDHQTWQDGINSHESVTMWSCKIT